MYSCQSFFFYILHNYKYYYSAKDEEEQKAFAERVEKNKLEGNIY